MADAARVLQGEASGLVVLTQDQLRTLIKEALAEYAGKSAPAVSTQHEYLTVEQVAEWLQADARTVRQWIKTDGLPAMRLGLREWRLARAAVLTWLEARVSKPGAHALKHAERLKRAKGGS